MSKVLRVGMLPGEIKEVAVSEGSTFRQALEIAGFNEFAGYELKVDGAVKNLDDTIGSTDNLALLVKQIKGNANGIVRVGQMPGEIKEFATEVGTPIIQLLEQAGLNYEGYEVKVDSQTVDPHSAVVTESTNLVLLTQRIKGNN